MSLFALVVGALAVYLLEDFARCADDPCGLLHWGFAQFVGGGHAEGAHVEDH